MLKHNFFAVILRLDFVVYDCLMKDCLIWFGTTAIRPYECVPSIKFEDLPNAVTLVEVESAYFDFIHESQLVYDAALGFMRAHNPHRSRKSLEARKGRIPPGRPDDTDLLWEAEVSDTTKRLDEFLKKHPQLQQGIETQLMQIDR